MYLDNRDEEKDMWQLQSADYVALKDQILSTLNFNQHMLILKKKADIICACYRQINNYPELI